MNAAIVTVFGVGRLPWAPGTWGSAAAIPMAWVVHWAGGFWALAMATLLVFVAGLTASKAYLSGRDEDPSEIVIDELAGQMIALWPLSFMLDWLDTPAHIFPWPGWLGAFILFRILDVVKPPPIRWLDRPGPWGIMMDDVAAGAVAGAIMFVAAGVSHGWF